MNDIKEEILANLSVLTGERLYWFCEGFAACADFLKHEPGAASAIEALAEEIEDRRTQLLLEDSSLEHAALKERPLPGPAKE